MKEFTSHSLEETKQIAKDWLVSISNEQNAKSKLDREEAFVVGLSGHLGAGKTAFTKCVAEILGIEEIITSPTFVIMKSYEIETLNFPWKRLIHIDAYRLERMEELEVLEWEKLVADKNNLILIEWPENVGLKDFEKGAHLTFDSLNSSYKVVIE